MNRILQVKNIEINACAIDKTENEFIVSFKFKSFNQPELTQLVKDFQSDVDIKEIVWNN